MKSNMIVGYQDYLPTVGMQEYIGDAAVTFNIGGCVGRGEIRKRTVESDVISNVTY